MPLMTGWVEIFKFSYTCNMELFFLTTYFDKDVPEEGILAREVLKVPSVAGDARQAEARSQLVGDSMISA